MSTPTRIGVISDTHIPYRARAIPPIVYELFQGVSMILHAGDLVRLDVLDELGVIAPVYAVYGNVDPPEVVARLPKKREIQVQGVRIGLVHGDGPGGSTAERALAAFPGADCIVFGHSHIPMCQRIGKTLLFNPGSATDRRSQPQHSVGLLTISGHTIEGAIIRF
ncbi:MAG TPA: metallophosphoesterase family protein [Limnochordia bacterium]|nr:metallophosphoesterase family protein [Limnochordia bacterium]